MKPKELFKDLQNNIDTPEVSLEDYLHAYDNVIEIDQAINDKSQDVIRSSEIAESLEDLMVVADNISSVTPSEANLIEIGGNIAVAGTSANAEDIVPSMESYVGTKIALEALSDVKEKIKKIWEWIKKTTKEIYKKLSEYIQQSSPMIAYSLNNVIKLEKEVKELSKKKPKRDQFELDTSRYDAIFNNGEYANNKSVFVMKQLIRTTKFFNSVTDEYTRSVSELIESVTRRINSVNANTDLESLKNEIFNDIIAKQDSIFSEIFQRNSEGAKTASTISNGISKVFVRTGIMGGLSFQVTLLDKNSITEIDNGTIERLRTTGIKVVPGLTGSSFPVIRASTPNRDLYTPEHIKDTVDESRDMVGSVKRFRDSGAEKKVLKINEKFQDAFDNLLSKFKEVTKEQEESLKQLASLSTIFTNWINKPVRGIIIHILKVERAVSWLVKKNIEHYVEAEPEPKDEEKKAKK